MMEPQSDNGSVNVIGQRMGDFSTTELYRILTDAGVPIGMMFQAVRRWMRSGMHDRARQFGCQSYRVTIGAENAGGVRNGIRAV